MSPVKIDGYELVHEVGRGASSVVFAGRQLALGGRLVAVKVIQGVGLDDAMLRRFERETASLGSLSGMSGIVTVYGSGRSDEGWPWLSMELMVNSLAGVLRSSGPIPWREIAGVGLVIGEALAAAHQNGIVHRDVKPENVLIDRDGRPKLADFGIAALGSSSTSTSMKGFSGTVAHAAPELLAGETPSVASDVYGLASTMYALAAGHAPHARIGEDNLLAMLRRMATEPIPDLRPMGVPDALASIIESGLRNDPYERATMESLLSSLRAIDGLTPSGSFALTLDGASTRSGAVASSPPATSMTMLDADDVWGDRTIIRGASSRDEPVPAGVPQTATDAAPLTAPPQSSRSETGPRARRRGVWWAVAAAAIVLIGGTSFALVGSDSGEVTDEVVTAPSITEPSGGVTSTVSSPVTTVAAETASSTSTTASPTTTPPTPSTLPTAVGPSAGPPDGGPGPAPSGGGTPPVSAAPAACVFADAGNKSTIRADIGSSFTDTLGNTYRVGANCTLTATSCTFRDGGNGAPIKAAVGGTFTDSAGRTYAVNADCSATIRSCSIRDAGNGATLRPTVGSTFTDSLGATYRLNSDCSLTATVCAIKDGANGATIRGAVGSTITDSVGRRYRVNSDCSLTAA